MGADTNEGEGKALEMFREIYEKERAAARENHEKLQKELEEAHKKLEKMETGPDVRTPEEKAVEEAKEKLAKCKKSPGFAWICGFFCLLYLLTVPGYIFGLMGGMPSALEALLLTKIENPTWSTLFVYVIWIAWALPSLVVGWIAGVKGGGMILRIVIVLIIAAMVALGVIGMNIFVSEKSLEKMGKWWAFMTTKRGKVAAAKAELRKTQEAYDKTSEQERKSWRQKVTKEHEEQVAAIKQEVEKLQKRMAENDVLLDEVGNMKLWHKRFEEYKKSDMYRRAVREEERWQVGE